MPQLALNYPQANTDPERLWYLVVTPLQQFTYNNQTYVPGVPLSNTPKPTGKNSPLKIVTQNTAVELPATEQSGALLRFEIWEKTPPPEPDDPSVVLQKVPEDKAKDGLIIQNPDDKLIDSFDRVVPNKATLTADDLIDTFYGPTLLDGSNFAIIQGLLKNTAFVNAIAAEIATVETTAIEAKATDDAGTLVNPAPTVNDSFSYDWTGDKLINQGEIIALEGAGLIMLFMALKPVINNTGSQPTVANTTTDPKFIGPQKSPFNWYLINGPGSKVWRGSVDALGANTLDFPLSDDSYIIRDDGIYFYFGKGNELRRRATTLTAGDPDVTDKRGDAQKPQYNFFRVSEYGYVESQSRGELKGGAVHVMPLKQWTVNPGNVNTLDALPNQYKVDVKRGDFLVFPTHEYDNDADNPELATDGTQRIGAAWYMALEDFHVEGFDSIPTLYQENRDGQVKGLTDRNAALSSYSYEEPGKRFYVMDDGKSGGEAGTLNDLSMPSNLLRGAGAGEFGYDHTQNNIFMALKGLQFTNFVAPDPSTNVTTEWTEAALVLAGLLPDSTDIWYEVTGHEFSLFGEIPEKTDKADIQIVPWLNNGHLNAGNYFFRGASLYKVINPTTMTAANDPSEPGAQWSGLYERVWTVPAPEAPKADQDNDRYALLDKPNVFTEGATFQRRLAASNPPNLAAKVDHYFPLESIENLGATTVLNKDVIDSYIYQRLLQLQGYTGEGSPPPEPTAWESQMYLAQGARVAMVATLPGDGVTPQPAPDAVLGQQDISKLIAHDLGNIFITGHSWKGLQTFAPGTLAIAPDGATLDPSHQVPNKAEVSTLLQQTMTGLGVLNHGTRAVTQEWTGLNHFRGGLYVGDGITDDYEVLGRASIASLVNQTVNSKAAELSSGAPVTAGVSESDDNTWTGTNIFEGVASFTGGATITNPSSGKAAILPRSEIETLIGALRNNPNQGWTGTNTFTGHLQVNRALERATDLTVLNKASIDRLIDQKLEDHDAGVDFGTAHTWDAVNTFSQGLKVGAVPDDDNAVLNRAAIATMISQHQVTLPSTVAFTNASQPLNFAQGLEVSKAGTNDNAVLRRVDIAQMIANNQPTLTLPQTLVYTNQANPWSEPQTFPALMVEAGGSDDKAVLGRADIMSLINANKPQAQTFSTTAAHTWAARQTFTQGALVGQATDDDNAVLGRADIQALIDAKPAPTLTLPNYLARTDQPTTFTQPVTVQSGGLTLKMGGAVDGNSVLNKSSIDAAIAAKTKAAGEPGVQLIFWASQTGSDSAFTTNLSTGMPSGGIEAWYRFNTVHHGSQHRAQSGDFNTGMEIPEKGVYRVEFNNTFIIEFDYNNSSYFGNTSLLYYKALLTIDLQSNRDMPFFDGSLRARQGKFYRSGSGVVLREFDKGDKLRILGEANWNYRYTSFTEEGGKVFINQQQKNNFFAVYKVNTGL